MAQVRVEPGRVGATEGGAVNLNSRYTFRTFIVGSANMDVRSFRLNFEVNAAIYGPEFASELAEVFERDLKQARQVTAEDRETQGMPSRMAESLARVMSPVL